MDEPNWPVVADMALKAASDAEEAIGRTVFLLENPMDAALVSMVALAILHGKHQGVRDAMGDSPIIRTGMKMADAVAAEIQDAKRAELKRLLPKIREAVARFDRVG